MMRTLRRTAAALAMTTAALGIAASAASAGTLRMDANGVVTYDAKVGETNDVTITQTLGSVTVSDSEEVELGIGCTRNGNSLRSGRCDILRPREIRVYLGNKDDTLDASAVTSRMYVEGNGG